MVRNWDLFYSKDRNMNIIRTWLRWSGDISVWNWNSSFANMISFAKLQFQSQVLFWNSRVTLYCIFHWGVQTPFSKKIFIPNFITVSENLTGNKHEQWFCLTFNCLPIQKSPYTEPCRVITIDDVYMSDIRNNIVEITLVSVQYFKTEVKKMKMKQLCSI